MSRGKPVTARAVGRHTVEVAGPDVYASITELGIPRMRPRGSTTAWLVSQDRAEQLLAHLERETGRRVEVTL
jgi:hypothetical protein